ncbi:MAG: diacylglycerol kinase family protein [Planctomycetota bacterium]
MKHYLVILNGGAGNTQAITDLEGRIRQGLGEGEGARVLVTRTRDAAEARRTARSAARSGRFDALVVAGGDGSLHQIVDGLSNSDLPLGLIPMGTANDLASRYEIPKHGVEEACAIIRAGQTTRLDLVRVADDEREEDKAFATGGGFGVVARVALGVQHARERSAAFRWLLRRVGAWIYPIVTLFTLLFARRLHQRYEVETADGRRRELEGYAALLMNLPSLGAHFQAAPRASERDGLLDVVLLERTGGIFSRLRFMACVAHIARGTHLGRADVHHFRARSLRVTAPGAACIADGELIAQGSRFDVEVDRKALTLLVPAAFAERAESVFASRDSRAA